MIGQLSSIQLSHWSIKAGTKMFCCFFHGTALHGKIFILQIEKANFIVSICVRDILVGSCGLKSGILSEDAQNR